MKELTTLPHRYLPFKVFRTRRLAVSIMTGKLLGSVKGDFIGAKQRRRWQMVRKILVTLEDVGWVKETTKAIRGIATTKIDGSKMLVYGEVGLSGVSGHFGHGTGRAMGFLLVTLVAGSSALP